MTDTITITLDDEQAQATFAELARRCTDMTGLMRKIGGHLADVAEESFATERSPDGVPWVDLSARTTAARAKRGYWPGQKLQVSGLLAASVTPQEGALVIGRDFVQIGSNVPYARIQQKGGKAGRGHKVDIPARPFLGISAEAREAIQADMVAWVDLNRSVGG